MTKLIVKRASLCFLMCEVKHIKSNATGATCGAGTAYPSVAPEFFLGF